MDPETCTSWQGHLQAVGELYTYIHVARSWDRADDKPGEAAQVVPPRRLKTIDPSDPTWIMMHRSYDLLCDYYSRTDRCQPIVLNMFLGEYFFPRGLQELQENFLIDFDREYNQRKACVHNMWATMAGMMQWQLQERSIWTFHDDKKRISKTFGLVGSAFLALLNEIDMAGLLKPDTEIHDLGLVMCMALEWTDRREEHEIDRSDLEWRNTVVAYAAKAKIDLNEAPIRNARTLVAGAGKVPALVGNARSGRWKWVRKFRQFKDEYSDFGGYTYDIAQKLSTQRASFAHYKQDVMPGIFAANSVGPGGTRPCFGAESVGRTSLNVLQLVSSAISVQVCRDITIKRTS